MKNIYLILMLIIICSCASFKIENKKIILDAWYVVEVEQNKVIFKSDGTFDFFTPSYDLLSLDSMTLSYGTWKIEDNLIEISSNPKLFDNQFKVEVKESFSGSKDSIYIYVENEELGGMYVNEVFKPYILYEAYIHFYDSYYKSKRGITSDVFSRKTKVYPEENFQIQKIELGIYPNIMSLPRNAEVEYAETISYKIKNNQNNTFHIRIVDFHYNHFSFKRYIGEYIKIIDEDTLIWDGKKCFREQIKLKSNNK